MKISVITPCLNAEKYIRETIESVIFQKGEFEIEYIIVDGKSTDSTLDIINEYVELSKNKNTFKNLEIKVVSEKDSGLYDALSKGFRMVSGDVVSYINADDYYMPNAFSYIKELFERGILWVTGLPLLYREDGVIIDYYIPIFYLRSLIKKGFYGPILPFVQQESVFFSRKLIEKIDFKKLGGYKLAGDYYLWHSFAGFCDLKVADAFLSGFRQHHTQLSKNINGYFEEMNQIRDRRNIFDYAIVYLIWFIDKISPVFVKNIFHEKAIKNA